MKKEFFKRKITFVKTKTKLAKVSIWEKNYMVFARRFYHKVYGRVIILKYLMSISFIQKCKEKTKVLGNSYFFNFQPDFHFSWSLTCAEDKKSFKSDIISLHYISSWKWALIIQDPLHFSPLRCDGGGGILSYFIYL